MAGSNNKKILIVLIFFLLFLLCLYLSLFAGYKTSGFGLFEQFITSNFKDDKTQLIFELLRTPRAIKAVIAGSCLSLAGLFMQSVTKNPLAEPYITGISSGAGLAIVISIILFNSANYSIWGFFGAFISSIIVILFAGLNRFSVTKLILVGLCVNIFVSSLISLVILTNPDKAYPMMLILSGGLTNTIASSGIITILFLFALALCLFAIPKLNFMRLDDNLISAFAQKQSFYTIFIIVLSSFLTSISVFSAGILGFVGIIIPQISKMLLGQDFRWLFLSSILLGSSLMLFSDYLSRILIYPTEIPLGLVLAFIGAPVFIFFLTKKGGGFYD